MVNEHFPEGSDAVRRARDLQIGEASGVIRIEHAFKNTDLYFDEQSLKTDISEALTSPDAYGAIDERFGDVRDMQSQSQVNKQRVAHVASDIFGRLPNFESASFEEIAEIKREPSKYLANFRKGVIQISQQIKSQPWDADFPHDVDLALRDRLLPEVEAIEDQVKSNSYLKQIVHRAAKDPLVLPGTSALGIALSSAFHFSSVAAQIAGAAAGAGLLAYEAHREWKTDQEKSEGNLFYFYYKAGKRLSGSSNKGDAEKSRGYRRTNEFLEPNSRPARGSHLACTGCGCIPESADLPSTLKK